MAAIAVRIKTIERESAQNLRDLQVRLHKTFVTPIDLEDISLPFEHLDHLLDGLEAISYRLTAYHLEPTPPLVVELAGRIHSSAELMEKAFGLLSRNESTEDLCKRIDGRTDGPSYPRRDHPVVCGRARPDRTEAERDLRHL